MLLIVVQKGGNGGDSVVDTASHFCEVNAQQTRLKQDGTYTWPRMSLEEAMVLF